jgi:hypothetical protein
MYRTGPTVTAATTVLGAYQSGLVAKQPQQRNVLGHILEVQIFAVDF